MFKCKIDRRQEFKVLKEIQFKRIFIRLGILDVTARKTIIWMFKFYSDNSNVLDRQDIYTRLK